MSFYYYQNSINFFLKSSPAEIIGTMASANGFDLQSTQRFAWEAQIHILKKTLRKYKGHIFFEFAIPRMGRRIDAVVLIQDVVFVLEFKVGESEFRSGDFEQVWDYALDLKNFHETSHHQKIVPVLIATEADLDATEIPLNAHDDQVYQPILSNQSTLPLVLHTVLQMNGNNGTLRADWAMGRYTPTPTIIEAAMALYNNHSVTEITTHDASRYNLARTSKTVSAIIRDAKKHHKKAICFVTGVPGAGKTLVGLDVATKHLEKKSGTTSVFLSGNGPLVAVLREALARDIVKRAKEEGKRNTKGNAHREVKVFIQNVHHFRDAYLADQRAPFDHVAIFDEAQRAWDLDKTAKFMKAKKNIAHFQYSEPEFLIRCMDRHKDWAVIVCLVGGGQEIHTGEAGISEWIEALNRSFPHWEVHISPQLKDSEYAAGRALEEIKQKKRIRLSDDLHLSVSLRSFRAEHLSSFIKHLLDQDILQAKKHLALIKDRYPMVITRDINLAKEWLRSQARGSQRYGLVVSSQAYRLKPLAIDIRPKVDPVHYFLNDRHDIRSSYFLEDVATEFQIQGLELDWVGVIWDADFRYSPKGWGTFSFKGDKWQRINQEQRKLYLKNAYRVLLTRARQGMVIVVPHGNPEDATRTPEFYDKTFNYLRKLGLEVLEKIPLSFHNKY